MNEKVVFVTGAGSGIGLEICRQFSISGCTVILTDLDEQKVQSAINLLRDTSKNVTGVTCDVTNEESLKAAIAYACQLYGRIDVLINNAGLQHVSLIEEFPTDKFELLIKVMLTAPFIAIKHVFPIMKKQGFGRVINMASINGLIGFSGKAAYNSAKHGVIGLTKVAALEGAEFGITVNAVCPGYVDTPLVRNQLASIANQRNIPEERVLEEILLPLVPQKRLLTAEEIAEFVLFLTSAGAKGITGQALAIDGGYTAQ